MTIASFDVSFLVLTLRRSRSGRGGCRKPRTFIPIDIAVLTVSDTRTDETDTVRSAPRLAPGGGRPSARGEDDRTRRRVPDPSLRLALDRGPGGARGGRDRGHRPHRPRRHPGAIRPLLDKEIDGFGELFRAISYEEIGTSTVNSRALGGVATAPSCSVSRGRRERADGLGPAAARAARLSFSPVQPHRAAAADDGALARMSHRLLSRGRGDAAVTRRTDRKALKGEPEEDEAPVVLRPGERASKDGLPGLRAKQGLRSAAGSRYYVEAA